MANRSLPYEDSLAGFLREVQLSRPAYMPIRLEHELRQPLAALVKRLLVVPAGMEARVIARILDAMATSPPVTDLRREEIPAISGENLVLLSAVIQDYISGIYDKAEVLIAVTRLRAAAGGHGDMGTLYQGSPR